MSVLNLASSVFELKVYQNKKSEIFSALGVLSLNEKYTSLLMSELQGLIEPLKLNYGEDFNNRIRKFLVTYFE